MESDVNYYQIINTGHYQEPIQKTINATNSLVEVKDSVLVQIQINLGDEYYNVGLNNISELLLELKKS